MKHVYNGCELIDIELTRISCDEYSSFDGVDVNGIPKFVDVKSGTIGEKIVVNDKTLKKLKSTGSSIFMPAAPISDIYSAEAHVIENGKRVSKSCVLVNSRLMIDIQNGIGIYNSGRLVNPISKLSFRFALDAIQDLLFNKDWSVVFSRREYKVFFNSKTKEAMVVTSYDMYACVGTMVGFLCQSKSMNVDFTNLNTSFVIDFNMMIAPYDAEVDEIVIDGLSELDVSNANTLSNMFSNVKCNTLDLSTWKLRAKTYINDMFVYADIDNLILPKNFFLFTGSRCYYAFKGCKRIRCKSFNNILVRFLYRLNLHISSDFRCSDFKKCDDEYVLISNQNQEKAV